MRRTNRYLEQVPKAFDVVRVMRYAMLPIVVGEFLGPVLHHTMLEAVTL